MVHVLAGPAPRLSTLRLDTLVKLRWMAVAGQLATVIGVHYGLGFDLPLEPCLALILVSATINLLIRLRNKPTERVNAGRAAAFLAYDIVQLAALLFLTGGLENPFAFLFLAPVMISATSLPPRYTLSLGVLAVLCATILTLWHLPLPWRTGESLSLPLLYVAGMWFSVLMGLGFIGIYAFRVSEEARQLSNALAATELVLAREQHLSQLDGLAAAAAHELGTPLATIALVAKELEMAVPKDGDLAEDIRLLRSQVERCREILGKLASLHAPTGDPFDVIALDQMIEEAVAPHRSFGIEIAVDLAATTAAPMPAAARNAGVLYGLGNIIENAVDFAINHVTVRARWDARHVMLVIEDDGPGIPPEILQRLGDPYVTNRRTRAEGQPGGGLGLGFFIAKTLLERSGASVSVANRTDAQSGAVATLDWPREAFERRADPA
ncbi:MAG: ActS/PrrB/RegB family redox-sensitive histidine kinase [Labrys sp. (in: a-proteobacteria)]